ncbi:MAG: transcriptional regulator CynR [Chloroflexota bacterium]
MVSIEMRQLRYLLAVVEEANFTRAAQKVFVSQSALSQQIQALEQEVGTVLLNRSRKGVQPTEAGEILVQHARRIFQEVEQAQTAIQELNGLLRGELHIGVVQTVNEYFMPELITRFSQTYPDIRLFVDELATDEIEGGLGAGNLQVGLSFLPTEHPGLDTQPLFQEPLVLIVHKDHPLASQSIVPVATLDAMPMIMLSKTFCTRRLWEENARLVSAEPRVMIEMNTVSSILTAVRRSDMVTVLPKHTLTHVSSADLVSIDLESPTPSRTVGLVWHTDYYLCSASRAFIDLAQSLADELGLNPL